MNLQGGRVEHMRADQREELENLRKQHELLKKMLEQQEQLRALQGRQEALMVMQHSAEQALAVIEDTGETHSYTVKSKEWKEWVVYVTVSEDGDTSLTTWLN